MFKRYSEKEIEEVAEKISAKVSKKIAEEVSKEMLNHVGIDFTEYKEIREDFIYLRKRRISDEEIRGNILLYGMGVLITGLIAALIAGVKHYIHKD